MTEREPGRSAREAFNAAYGAAKREGRRPPFRELCEAADAAVDREMSRLAPVSHMKRLFELARDASVPVADWPRAPVARAVRCDRVLLFFGVDGAGVDGYVRDRKSIGRETLVAYALPSGWPISVETA